MDSLQSHVQAYLSYLQAHLNTGFWHVHGIKMGIVLLIGTYFFPRVTTPFIIGIPFRLPHLFWLGYFWWVVPRILIAAYLTSEYWKTNREIWILAWLIVLIKSPDDLEKRLVDKCLKALNDNWDEIKKHLSVPAKGFVLVVGGLVGVLTVLTVFVGVVIANAITFTVVLVFLAGFALYFFRQKRKFWYGVFEILAALFISGYTIWRTYHFTIPPIAEFVRSSDFFATLVGLLTSVYIVVRGLDNIDAEGEVGKFLDKLKSLWSKLICLLFKPS